MPLVCGTEGLVKQEFRAAGFYETVSSREVFIISGRYRVLDQ